jgi:hypothetical protein
MRQSATLAFQAEELPKELAAALAERPVSGSRYRVTVEEVEATDEMKLAALRAAIQKGRDDIAAGKVIDGEAAFAELRDKYFPAR